MLQTIDALALIGWMDEVEAVRFLVDGCVAPRARTETEARATWRAYRDRTLAAASARPLRAARVRLVETDQSARFLAAVRGFADRVVEVNPADLLALQFRVALWRSEEHAAGAATATWAERCLVADRPRQALPVTAEGNSLTFDLPHGEHALVLSPEGELRVDQSPGFVIIGPVGDTYLLRGGYHRAYAYLRTFPAPTEPFLAAVCDGEPRELRDPALRAKLTSDQPPLVGDFLNPDLAMPVKLVKHRYRFKVTAEMSYIPLD